MRLICFLCATAALIAAPSIRDITPRGAQRGKTVRLVLKGSDLNHGDSLRTSIPGSVSRLAPTEAGQLPFLIEVTKDAQVGVYPLRLVSADGLSNVMLFSVGDFPEVEERDETPDKQDTPPQSLPTPVVVNGTLRAADVDTYAIDVKVGQKLVFEVESYVLASAIDPAIEIIDPAGKTVMKNDDAAGSGIDVRVEHLFKTGGRYLVRVRDSKYSDQSANHYRLKIGSYPYADALFPLGWKRGEQVTVTATGGNLAQPVSLKPDTAAKSRFVPVRLPGSASAPFLFELSDAMEALEPESAGPHSIARGTIVNGRIAKKGEVDRYTLTVKPGDHWMFEVRASSLGTSRLDALLTVYDAQGKKLASRDDLGSADPVLPFEVPKDVTEVTLAVEDLLGRGGDGFGYRLQTRNEPADFLVKLQSPFINVPAGGTTIINALVQRRGYDGALRLSVPNLPKGFHVAGGHVAPSAAQQRFDDPNPRFNTVASTLTITADADAAVRDTELTVVGTALTPAGNIVRKAEGPGLVVAVKGLRQKSITAAWLEMDLPIAVSKALPVKLGSASPPHVRIAQGVEYPLSYRVDKGMGVRVQGKVKETIASAVGNLRILQGPAGKTPDSGTLLINTNFATPAEKFDMLSSATTEIDGKTVEVYAPMVTFEIAQGFRVQPAESEWRVGGNGFFTLAGTIYREPTFEGGAVKLDVQELPEGVACTPADVDWADREFTIFCEAKSTAPKGTHEFQIAAQAPETGRAARDVYKIPSVSSKLNIQ